MRLVLATLALLSASVLVGGPALAAGGAPTVVKVTLEDDKIVVDTPTIPAGEVEFVVSNVSAFDVHEMVVVLGDDSTIVVDPKTDRVDEDKLESLGEVEDLDAGKTSTLDVTMKPGPHTLLCNIKGHYRHGMHAVVTVQ